MPSVLSCMAMTLALKASMRIRGLARTLHWIGRRAGGVPSQAPVDSGVVLSVERQVAMAGALYPGRALCLEQSLVLYYILRSKGVPVVYRQGIQAHPFAAHAWIEYEGRPINDIREHTQWFTTLPSVLP